MFKIIIIALSDVINIYFIKLRHPISIILFITLQTFLVGLITGTIIVRFWLSYISFLTFLGGKLVLVIYITRSISYEIFQPKSITIIFTFIIWTFIIFIFIIFLSQMIQYL